jgi:hypothetical protein
MSNLSDFMPKPYLGLAPFASGLAYTLPDPVFQLESTDTSGGGSFPQLNLKSDKTGAVVGGKITWQAQNSLPAYVTHSTIQAYLNTTTSGAECSTIAFGYIAAGVPATLAVRGDSNVLGPVVAGALACGNIANAWSSVMSGDGTVGFIMKGLVAGSLLGTTTNHPFSIITNNVAKATVNAAGDWSFGPAATPAINTKANGDVILGIAGTTAMTAGFGYIPGGAGPPTGAPTARSGFVPFYFDTTNNFLYFYNGSWKKSTVYA